MTMRLYLTVIFLWVISLAAGSAGCGQNRPAAAPGNGKGDITYSSKGTKMKIKIGSKTFDATLFDNPTAEAFKAMLPLTLQMEELNGNEKKYDFSKGLPTDAANPKTIERGDLMIWQKNTLVLFYKSFPTSYSYTKLGKIDGSSGLEAAVGKGNVMVTFELDGSTKEKE